MWKSILLVGLGGGIGSILRFWISNLTHKYLGTTFPFATLLVNLIGCLLIGFLMGWIMKSQSMGAELRLLLVVGFCGGFTTFSTFALENLNLIQSEKYLLAILYILGSVVLGILGVCLGLFLAKINLN